MQLIITTCNASTNSTFIENLKTYKYRHEVKLLIDMPETELVKITGASYAFMYPAMYEGIAIFPLQAMQCEVPVITSNTGAIIETMGDAALFAAPENFEDIADKMMLLFKDENKRAELIKKGKLKIENPNNSKQITVGGLFD